MDYALVRSGVVHNVATGDEAWADSIRSEWDHVIDITNAEPRPGVRWRYDGASFSPPPTVQDILHQWAEDARVVSSSSSNLTQAQLKEFMRRFGLLCERLADFLAR